MWARSDGSLPASIDRNYPVFGPGATTANVNAPPALSTRACIGSRARARVGLQRAIITACN